MEINKTYLGDCIELMPQIPSGSIDMILCDLPYGTTACKWDVIIPFEPLWNQYKRIIKPNGAIVLTASQPFTSKLVMSNIKWFKYELIWDKNYGVSPGIAKYRPLPSHESIIVFGNGVLGYNPQMMTGKPYIDLRKNSGCKKTGSNEHKFGYKIKSNIYNTGTRFPLSVIHIQNHNTPGKHPTQKPITLFEYLIRTFTNEGETVLDNCAGSGTTAISCINAKRNYILMEKEQKYLDIIEKRIKNHIAQPTLF